MAAPKSIILDKKRILKILRLEEHPSISHITQLYTINQPLKPQTIVVLRLILNSKFSHTKNKINNLVVKLNIVRNKFPC